MMKHVQLILSIVLFIGLTSTCSLTAQETLKTIPSESYQAVNKNIKVFWGLLGSYPKEKQYNPYELTREDKEIDAASILYSIRRDYKTIEQISKQTNIDIRDIEKKLNELKKCELVTKKKNKFIVNFPFWDIPLRDKINSLGFELTDQIVQIIKSEIPNLKVIFKETSLSTQGYTWDDVSLIIIGGLLLDTGLNDRGLRKWKVFDQKRDTPIRPGDYLYWYKAVENGWGNYWKFGHNMIHNNNFDVWTGMFYGSIKGRKTNWAKTWNLFDDNTSKILFPIIKKAKIHINELQSKSNISVDSLNAILYKMEETKIIKIDDSIVYPNFPVFNEKDIKLILTKVDSICNNIINDIYVPFLPKIQRTWKEIEPSNWEIQSIDKFFTRQVYSRPYNLTLDRLIREGVLPPSPIDPPFNYWGINGHYKAL